MELLIIIILVIVLVGLYLTEKVYSPYNGIMEILSDMEKEKQKTKENNK